MSKFASTVRRFVREETGATMAEYALLVAAVALVAITAVRAFGGDVSALFGRASTELKK